MSRFFTNLWYWVTCHFWTRYHIVDISGQADYEYGWIDRDHAMLLACFKLLTDFVENEDPEVGRRTFESVGAKTKEDKDAWRIQLKRDKEVRALYDWWTTERPKAYADGAGFQAMLDMREQEQKMLEKLIRIRGCLWT